MRRRSSSIVAALAATMLLGLAVSDATARNLSVNEQSFRWAWTPITFAFGGNTVRCNLTFEGSFHYRTMAKSIGSLIGFVTRAILNTCTGGSATILTLSLPWHVRYGGFTGTLPNITTVRSSVTGISFNFRPTGLGACLAQSTAENPARFIAILTAGVITGVMAEEGSRIPLRGFLCEFAEEMSFAGTSSIATTLGGPALSLRLI